MSTEKTPIPPVREEPLPDTQPPVPPDDPEAADRVQALISSPAYTRADQDSRFLRRDELRPSRLGLEYLKPELALQERNIRSTIVFFGGTRILEPLNAAQRVEHLKTQLAEKPGDTDLQTRLRVAERIQAKSHYYDVARDFAHLASQKSPVPGQEFVITTGGGPGIMEAGNRGAFDAGVPSVGLNITLPMEQYPNSYITPDLCFHFRYFALRKFHFLKRAKALVAFPGGYGTLDEIMDALCLVQTRKIEPIPIILVGKKFWSRALDARFLAEEGVIAEEDIHLFRVAETAPEIWSHIREWWGL